MSTSRGHVRNCSPFLILCFTPLLLLLWHPAAASSSSRLSKCCGPQQILTGDDGLLACISAHSWYTQVHWVPKGDIQLGNPGLKCSDKKIVRDNETLLETRVFYNTTNTSLEHLPRFIGRGSCLDVLHDKKECVSRPVLVECRRQEENSGDDEPEWNDPVEVVSRPNVVNVRKCCSPEKTYSLEERTCLPGNHQPNVTFLNDVEAVEFAVVEHDLPECQGVVVDYKIKADDLFLEDGSLWANVPGSGGMTRVLAGGRNNCLDLSATSGNFVLRACTDLSYCKDHPCLRKCCPESEHYVEDKCLRIPDLEPTAFHRGLSRMPKNMTKAVMNGYGLIVGKPCRWGMFPAVREDQWHITPKGHVNLPGYKVYEHHEYCMDIFYNSSEFLEETHAFICFEDPNFEENTATQYDVNVALQVVSCILLLVTLVVYICLPTLQNLHGKTLMCHVGSLLGAYTCLAIVAISGRLHVIHSDELDGFNLCKFLGYTIMFCFLSSFSWLNVMCFDIWWTFGGAGGTGGSARQRNGHRKRFLLYNLYAWGSAGLITLSALIAKYSQVLPYSLTPHIGLARCWFVVGSYGEILFFTGPISIQLLSNIIFFVLTARTCSKIKGDILRLTSSSRDQKSRKFQADKTILIMNVKLFIVMGLTWLFEVASSFSIHFSSDLQWIFYATDIVNCLQGLLIFVLFVVKRRVYQALRKRLGLGDSERSGTNNATMDQLQPFKIAKCSSNATLTSNVIMNTSEAPTNDRLPRRGEEKSRFI